MSTTKNPSDSSVHIILVRHGESLGNVSRILTGQTDVPLTERGVLQAEITADFLKNEHIDAIYSSDLQRAYNTALPHARLREMTVKRDFGLREIFIGDWEARPMSLITENSDPEFPRYFTDLFGVYSFPGGESTVLAGERFYRTLERIATANPGRRILVTSHAAVIRAFWGKMCAVPADELGAKIPFPTNASYSRVLFSEGRFVPLEFSRNEHLQHVGFVSPGKI